MSHSNELCDLNKDGVIDDVDKEIYTTMIKSRSQLCLACVALFSILGVTLLMMTPFVDIERIKAMETLLEVFYIANGTIVAAWFGLDSYLSINKR